MNTHRLGQLFMFGFEGTKATPELCSFIKETGCGGVIIFSRNYKNPKQLKELIKALQDVSEIPLMVGVDQEGGRVARLTKPFTKLPSLKEIGENPDPKFARKMGELVGSELSAVGINVNFSPVLDVSTNPFNPIIGDRSFGNSAQDVARLGREFILGMQSKFVAACGKHFPGHGDTDADSHINLPVLSNTHKRFKECEFVPFKMAIDSGVASMMVAHIFAPNLDPDFPATISHRIVDGILRKELGFDGLVFTDDLLMKGIADTYAPKDSAWMSIAAGQDVAMICREENLQREALEGLAKAIDEGKISENIVAKALARVAGFKSHHPRA